MGVPARQTFSKGEAFRVSLISARGAVDERRPGAPGGWDKRGLGGAPWVKSNMCLLGFFEGPGWQLFADSGDAAVIGGWGKEGVGCF
jgi:hypothetical protein